MLIGFSLSPCNVALAPSVVDGGGGGPVIPDGAVEDDSTGQVVIDDSDPTKTVTDG
jgi:hypothetical protein